MNNNSENTKNVFIIGAGFSKHFFNLPIQEELLKNLLNDYLKNLHLINDINNKKNSYLHILEKDENFKDEIVYGFPLIYYLCDYWKMKFIFEPENELSLNVEIIEKLFSELLLEYVNLRLVKSSNDHKPKSSKTIDEVEDGHIEEDNLTPKQVIKIYEEIIKIKSKIIMIVDEILKFDNDIEIIATKIMKTLSWNNNYYDDQKYRTIKHFIWVSISKHLFIKNDNEKAIAQEKSIFEILKNQIIIVLNWDTKIESLFKKNNDYNVLVISEINNLIFFNQTRKNNNFDKTIIIKPHFESGDNLVFPSFFRNFSEFNFRFFKNIFDEIKSKIKIKNIVFFGIGFNKADSYIYHQMFNLMHLDKKFKATHIYYKNNEDAISSEIKKYIVINKCVTLNEVSDDPNKTIEDLLNKIKDDDDPTGL
ncbi:MAG: hypothetical protein ACRC1F_00495 [Metamycoplasmataceae bacterium]